MLCDYMKSSSATGVLGLIRDVQRVEIDHSPAVVFLIDCRACNAVHSQEVPWSERPGALYPPAAEFWAWLVSKWPTLYKRAA